MDWNLGFQIVGMLIGIGGTLVFLTYWLNMQFSRNREYFFNKIDSVFDKLMSKLEYHERHDDIRFSEIRNDLTEIRIKNAYVDARLGNKPLDQEENQPRRQTRASTVSGSVS